MIKKFIFVSCDVPGCDSWPRFGYFSDVSSARAEGWVFSHDRKTCFCPSCGKFKKNIGRPPRLSKDDDTNES